jgi:hypothetical protein
VRLKSLLAILFATLFIWQSPASAHQLSTGYLILNKASADVDGQLQLRWFDLDLILALDADKNGDLTWGEVSAQRDLILDYAASNLNVSDTEGQCSIRWIDQLQTERHLGEGYAVIEFVASCTEQNQVVIDYTGIFAQDKDHKLLINFMNLDVFESGVISTDERKVVFKSEAASSFDTFVTYVYQGMIHIWLGLDHILFLATLLLTSVLIRKDNQWQAHDSVSGVMKDTIWVVTAFTLAHSVTLTATALNWLSGDIGLIELGIALSVLLSALNNIWPVVLRLGWITFAFGLLHGMGFASVLGELGLDPNHTVLSVLAFNLGVEIGQLAILFALVPILLVCRRKAWYRTLGVNAVSAVIAAIALYWCWQRF